MTLLEVILDSFVNELEFRALPVLLRAFEIKLFILGFRSSPKLVDIDEFIEFELIANTFGNDGDKINDIVNDMMIAYILAIMFNTTLFRPLLFFGNLPVIVNIQGPRPDTSSLEVYSHNSEKAFNNMLDTIKITKSGKDTLGIPGLNLEKMQVFTVVNDNTAYVVIYGAEQAEYNKNIQYVERLINSKD
jgi:hypothetical protein